MKLHYQQSGEGKPLFIIHGLFGSADNWRGIVKQLMSTRHVISVDLRNHGRSPHDDEQSYQAMAEDIAELIGDLKLDKVDIIGHSIGGKAVIALANDYPQLVDRLMIVDIATRAYPDRHSDIFKALLALDLSQYSKRNEVDAALSESINDKAIRQFLLMNLMMTEQGLSWRNNLQAQFDNYQQLLEPVAEGKQITLPTCFVRGSLSDYIVDDDIETIKQQFSDCLIETVDGVGHWIHAEAPAEFLQLVDSFLAHD